MKNIEFKRIYLRNYKNHDEAELMLSPNRFVTIVRRNGAGKTTFFDAICTALYDETTKGQKGDDIVRLRSGKNCMVRLEFNIGTDEYVIENYRKDKTNGSGKYVFKNGEDISKATRKETNEFLEDLVMPKKLFFHCLMFSQFMKQSFSKMPFSQQKDIIDQMLSLSQYDEYLAKIKEHMKEADESVRESETEKTVLEELIREKRNTGRTRYEYWTEHLLDIKNTIESHQNEIAKIEKELKEEKRARDEYARYLKKVEEELSLYASKEEELKSLRKRRLEEGDASEKRLISERDRKISAFENNLYKNELSSIDRRENEIQFELKNLDLNYKTLISSVESERDREIANLNHETSLRKTVIENAIEKVSSELGILESFEKEKIETGTHLGKTVSGKTIICPECGQPIEDKNKIDELKTRIQNLKNEIQDIRENKKTKTESLNQSKKEMENLKQEYINGKSRILKSFSEKIESIKKPDKKILETELEELNKKRNGFETALEKYREEMEEEFNRACESEWNEINKKYKRREEDLRREIEEMESREEDIRKELQRLGSVIEEYVSLRSTLESKQKSIEDMESKYRKGLETRKMEVEEVKAKIAEIEKRLEDIANRNREYSEKKDILKFWCEAFGDTGIRSIILDEAIPVLNRKAKEICKKLSDRIRVTFQAQSIIKSGDMRNKFSIRALNTQEFSGADNLDQLSAGELKIVDMVVLLSLRHLLEQMSGVRINVVLLDEILDNLDSENALRASETLKGFSDEYCVVLITHTLRDYIEADENIVLH